MSNYTVIGHAGSRTFRVVWALEEMSIEYDIIPAKPHQEEIKAINPSGKVPALIDKSSDSEAIIDSVAIVQYLADKHQQLTFPAGTIERARQDSFTQFACDDMDGILWTVAKHTFVMPEELRAKDAVKNAAVWDFARAMKSLSQRLGDNEFVMGDRMTVPDIILGHCSGWAGRVNLEVSEPNLVDYFARLTARPAFEKALALREAHSQL